MSEFRKVIPPAAHTLTLKNLSLMWNCRPSLTATAACVVFMRIKYNNGTILRPLRMFKSRATLLNGLCVPRLEHSACLFLSRFVSSHS